MQERQRVCVVSRALLPAPALLHSPTATTDPVLLQVPPAPSRAFGLCARALDTDASAIDGCICSTMGHRTDAPVELRLLCMHHCDQIIDAELTAQEEELSRNDYVQGLAID